MVAKLAKIVENHIVDKIIIKIYNIIKLIPIKNVGFIIYYLNFIIC